MFTKINRSQLLAVAGWSSRDFDNRVHNNQISLAFGLTLPAENGVYIGADVFALRLADEFVRAGFSWTQAGQLVREHPDKWLRGLERIEWPDLFSKPEGTPFVTTGGEPAYLDTGIHFAIAQNQAGLQVASGTLPENIFELSAIIRTGVIIRHINLGWVYTGTLKAAEKAGVDLGAPFTRPDHPEHRDAHREWYASVEVHRALSFARQKVRNPPGPPPANSKPRRPARAPVRRRKVLATT